MQFDKFLPALKSKTQEVGKPGGMRTGRSEQEKNPFFSEKMGKIMKKIQEARHSVVQSGGQILPTGGKRRCEKFSEKIGPPAEIPLVGPSGRTVFKSGRPKTEFRRLTSGEYPGTFGYGTNQPGLTTATRQREDYLGTTTMLDPIVFQEEFWYSAKAMWGGNEEKDAGAPNLNAIAENDSESLPFSVYASEDVNPSPFNRLRPRVGRSIKRRRRDLKTAAARRIDPESSSPPSPGTSPSPRKFVIPDVPFEISEALSMDVINAAYDFIHNG